MDIGSNNRASRIQDPSISSNTSQNGNVKAHNHRSTSRKENRDILSSMANTLVAAPKDARKRKLSDANGVSVEAERTKKHKANGDPLAEKAVNQGDDVADHGKVNGIVGPSFYCHQCSKKRDMAVEITCTWLGTSNCRARYCKACLRNRYGQDLDAIKKEGLPDRKGSEGHTRTLGYIWKCPRCSKCCNCKSCRKKAGLGPTGNLLFAARKQGLDSAAQMLEVDPSVLGVMRGQKLSEEDKSKRAKVPKIVVTEDGNVAPVNGEKLPKKKAKPAFDQTKEPPEPEWEAINPDLTRDEIEDRITLREFAIRFSALLELKLNSLDDLDEFDHFTDPSCVAFLKGMVNVLNCEHPDKGLTQILGAAKAGAFNVSKAWNALEQARSTPDASRLLRKVPDPSEIASTSYNTRTGQRIIQAVQLVPILKYLMERTLETQIIHDDLEEATNEWKNVHRNTINGVKDLREKLAAEKKTIGEKIEENEKKSAVVTELKKKVRGLEKTTREAVANLELSEVQLAPLCAPRFRPLGTDLEGRVYYILSPLNSRRRIREEDRVNFRKWSTFLLVWGKPGAHLKPVSDPSDSEEEDENGEKLEKPDLREEQWWGFYDTKDIRKLAAWLQFKGDYRDAVHGPVGPVRRRHENKSEDATDNGDGLTSGSRSRTISRAASVLSDLSALTLDKSELEEDIGMGDPDFVGPTSSVEMKTLVKRMNEFADWLDWRMQRPE